jgi:hypothetical protein
MWLPIKIPYLLQFSKLNIIQITPFGLLPLLGLDLSIGLLSSRSNNISIVIWRYKYVLGILQFGPLPRLKIGKIYMTTFYF